MDSTGQAAAIEALQTALGLHNSPKLDCWFKPSLDRAEQQLSTTGAPLYLMDPAPKTRGRESRHDPDCSRAQDHPSPRHQKHITPTPYRRVSLRRWSTPFQHPTPSPDPGVFCRRPQRDRGNGAGSPPAHGTRPYQVAPPQEPQRHTVQRGGGAGRGSTVASI